MLCLVDDYDDDSALIEGLPLLCYLPRVRMFHGAYDMLGWR